MIRTQFQPHSRVHANPGNPEKVLYSPKFASDGSMELVEAGKENLYDYIQSHKESVDINVILKRFAKGDVTALQRRQAMFGDFSDAPSNYAEALNSMIVAEQYFNSLPLETRAKFNHNFHSFLVSLDRPDFSDLIASTDVVSPSVASKPVDVVSPSVASKPVEEMPEAVRPDGINTIPDTPAT